MEHQQRIRQRQRIGQLFGVDRGRSRSVWSVTPTYSRQLPAQEDAPAHGPGGGGVNASPSEDAIVNTATSGWGEGSTSTTYSGSGSVADYGGTNSWAPGADGTGVELNGGTPPLGTVPDLWSLAGSERACPARTPGERAFTSTSSKRRK